MTVAQPKLLILEKKTTDLNNPALRHGTCQCPVPLALWHMVMKWHSPTYNNRSDIQDYLQHPNQ